MQYALIMGILATVSFGHQIPDPVEGQVPEVLSVCALSCPASRTYILFGQR